ncbi:MAG: hypothetical protein R3Y53_02140 [Bacillota bacterium]
MHTINMALKLDDKKISQKKSRARSEMKSRIISRPSKLRVTPRPRPIKSMSNDTEKNKSFKTIEELFEGYEGEYESPEIDWGKPVGDEVW